MRFTLSLLIVATLGLHFVAGGSDGSAGVGRGLAVAEFGGAPATDAVPPSSEQEGNLLRTPVIAGIAADGKRVALALYADCAQVEVWEPETSQLTAFPTDFDCPDYESASFRALALAGPVAAWIFEVETNHSRYYLLAASLEQADIELDTQGLVLDQYDDILINRMAGDRELIILAQTVHDRGQIRTDVWSLSDQGSRQLRQFAGDIRSLSADSDRIAVARASGKVLVLGAQGQTVRVLSFRAARLRGAALDDGRLVVLTRAGIASYRISSGRRQHLWPLAPRSPKQRQLEDAHRNLAVYVEGQEVHVLRLSDGRDVVIDTQPGPLRAQLDDAGLFYSWLVSSDREHPGRVRFLPYPELLERIGGA